MVDFPASYVSFREGKMWTHLFWYAEAVSEFFPKKNHLSSLIDPTSSTDKDLCLEAGWDWHAKVG